MLFPMVLTQCNNIQRVLFKINKLVSNMQNTRCLLSTQDVKLFFSKSRKQLFNALGM